MDEVTFVVGGIYAVTVGSSIAVNMATTAADGLLYKTMAEIRRRNWLALQLIGASLAN